MIRRALQNLLTRIAVPEPVAPPWGLPLALGLATMYLVVFFLAYFFVSTLQDVEFDAFDPSALAWGSLLATLLMGVLLWQYINNALVKSSRKTKLTFPQALMLNPPQETPLYAVMLIAFGTVILVDVIGLALGVAEDSLPLPIQGLRLEDGAPFWVAVVAIIVTRPIIEELIFRGALYGALAKSAESNVQAVLISAGAFTALHFVLDSQLWWGIAYPLALGLVAGATRAATKSTLAAIGVHAMFGIFIVLRAILTQ